jgi:hypothetical protein
MGIDFLTRGITPWGQSVFTHISWDLLWVSFFAGVVFLAAHSVYMLLSAHSKRASADVDALEAKLKGLPEKIQRHSLPARMFHWIMAASMLTLLHVLPAHRGREVHPKMALMRLSCRVDPLPSSTPRSSDFWSIWVGRGHPDQSEIAASSAAAPPAGREVPARQPPVSHGDRRDGHPRPPALRHPRPLHPADDGLMRLSRPVSRSWASRWRTSTSPSARETLADQVDAFRLHHAAPVLNTTTPPAGACRAEPSAAGRRISRGDTREMAARCNHQEA